MNEQERLKQGCQLVCEFSDMLAMAELKALSKASLERQLSNREYKRMMELKKEVGV